MSGQAGSGGSGGSMGNIPPAAIADLQKSLSQSSGPGMSSPGFSDQSGHTFAPSSQFVNPHPSASAPPAATPNPIGMAQQQGSTAGLTAGLGAGDAAAAAAQASGAMLPGSGSASALSGMMSNMSAQQKAAIQQKINMAKMLMGG